MMPSSPLLGRRSNSPQIFHDPIKDRVIGELASRIGKPIEFNKNKRGKQLTLRVGSCGIDFQTESVFARNKKLKFRTY